MLSLRSLLFPAVFRVIRRAGAGLTTLPLALALVPGLALNHTASAATHEPAVEVLRLMAVVDDRSAPQPHLYTQHADHLRIERVRPPGPVHWNLVDLAADVVTVIYPHNHSYETLPPPPKETPAAPAPATVTPLTRDPASTGLDAAQLAALPPDLRERLLAASAPARAPAPTSAPAVLAAVPGSLPEAISPDFSRLRGAHPSPPGAPGVPSAPAGGLPAVPNLPPEIAALMNAPLTPPASSPAVLELQPDEPRTLIGLACHRYLLRSRGEEVELWATTAAPFPFHRLIRERDSRPGMMDLHEQWAQAALAQGLFPLEVRTLGPTPRTLFAVVSLQPEQLPASAARALFAVPVGYQAIDRPEFARRP